MKLRIANQILFFVGTFAMKNILIILCLILTTQAVASGFVCTEDYRQIELHGFDGEYSFILVTKPPVSKIKRAVELLGKLKCHFSADVRFINCANQSSRFHSSVKGDQFVVEIHFPRLDSSKTLFHFDMTSCKMIS